MTAPEAKAESPAPLRSVKVTAISAGQKRANGPSGTQRSASGHEAQRDNIQLDEVVNKGLNLAETGIGLGMDIAVRLGTILKDQVFDRIGGSEAISSVMNGATSGHAQSDSSQHPEAPPAQPSPEPAPGEQPANYVMNRLPLGPGSDFSLSFSINNDSLTTENTISLELEAFVGEASQYTIDAGLLSVTPPQVTVAPADFEKLVISGHIPEDAPLDRYYGCIIVTEKQAYRIPVLLVVGMQGDIPAESATGPDQSPAASADASGSATAPEENS